METGLRPKSQMWVRWPVCRARERCDACMTCNGALAAVRSIDRQIRRIHFSTLHYTRPSQTLRIRSSSQSRRSSKRPLSR
jgi:hypothetical protein